MTRFSNGAAQRTESPDDGQRLESWYAPGLSDAIGDRVLLFDNTTASPLELLRFRPEFAKTPGFEEALRRRVEDLALFTHPSLAMVRAVEQLGEEDGLGLISNHIVGRRLSEILEVAHGPQFAAELVGQLVPVLAALQGQGEGMAHGLLTPERVTVTPEGRLILTEHVLGSAIDALRLSPARLRDELGVIVPPGTVSLDSPRADIIQLGYLAVRLLVAHRVRSLDAARTIVSRLSRQSPGHDGETPAYLKQWLGRALDVDGTPFASAKDAQRALTEWPERELPEDEPFPTEAAAPEQKPVVSTPPRPESIVVQSVVAFSDPAPRPPLSEPAVQPPELPTFVPVRQDAHTGRQPLQNPFVLPQFEEALRSEILAKPALEREFRPEVHETPDPPPPPFEAVRAELRPQPVPEPEILPETAPARAESTASRNAVPVSRRLVAGLAFVCLVEALIIAALLASRGPATNAPGQTASVAAESIAPDTTTAPSPVEVASATAPAGTQAPTQSPAERTTTNVKPLTATTAAPARARGWLTVDSPLDLQVFEGSTLVGTTKGTIMLPSGSHTLRVVSTALDFEAPLRVEIPAGRGLTTRVPTPNGALSLNALPWANVSLDGQPLGRTPFANLEVPVGTHEVVWHHPQFGERRQTVVVTATRPARLMVDLRQ